jgi:hypothetical protein
METISFTHKSKRAAELIPDESWEGTIELEVEIEFNLYDGEVQEWKLDEKDSLTKILMMDPEFIAEIEAFTKSKEVKKEIQEIVDEAAGSEEWEREKREMNAQYLWDIGYTRGRFLD